MIHIKEQKNGLNYMGDFPPFLNSGSKKRVFIKKFNVDDPQVKRSSSKSKIVLQDSYNFYLGHFLRKCVLLKIIRGVQFFSNILYKY